MNNQLDRREFMKVSAAAAGGATLAANMGMARDAFAGVRRPGQMVRFGFIGIGGRGSYHLDSALGTGGILVPAIAEIRPDRLDTAKKLIEAYGQPTPRLYSGADDWKRMLDEVELDAVMIATPWKLHAPIALQAMRTGKNAVSEVPIVLTVDEAWDIIETHEKTGKWATLATEQVLLESRDGRNLAVLNMIQDGLLGEIIQTETGYIHDLRRVKNDPEEEPWRLWHSIHRNGNLYPDHPMNRMMPYTDVNHGDRFDFLMSMSTRSGMMNEYAKSYYGPNHPNTTVEYKLGDYNATVIRTVNGKVITLNHDTNTPHPRESFRIQGSKGIYTDGVGGPKIYLDGRSPEQHEWEDAAPYLLEYQHPLIKSYNPPERPAMRGHGGGATHTPLTWALLLEALRRNEMPYFDVYDSVTSSVVSPLTEKSVANKSRPVDFPDFTRGKWQTRPRLTLTNFLAYV